MTELVTKTRHCVKCAANTTHVLVTSKYGSDWRCQSCNTQYHAFSYKEMADIVMRKVFGLPKEPELVAVPSDLRVFLKHHGPEADEKEASPESILQHVKLTGQLPVVGKPLYASPNGIAHPGFAVPYGEVARVEGHGT